MLTGMALGVAVVFAVDIANDSSKRAFAISLDTVTGRTTHQIVGGAGGLDESIYTTLRTKLGIRRSAPIVEGRITLAPVDATTAYSESLQLLGVDIFAEPMFRDSNITNSPSTRESLKLLHTGSVILADTTAQRLGVIPGDSIQVSVESGNRSGSRSGNRSGSRSGNASGNSSGSDSGNSNGQLLTLLNTIKTSEQPGFESIAMVDIATAQKILNRPGKLSRIDLILPDTTPDRYKNQGEALLTGSDKYRDIQTIESVFPNVTITDAARRSDSLMQMTEAFHTNLLAMSLLALLVGAFLIYNTVTLSVIQRRQTFGQLRTIGIQRHELFRSILVETLIFAIVGTLAGIVLGYLLGSVLLTLVTRTINDLYFTLDVRQVSYSTTTSLKACVIGLGVSLLAALAPAIEASRSAPAAVIRRTTVESRVNKLVPKIFIVGLISLFCGFTILWISKASLWAGFFAIFCIVLGYSLTIPRLIIAITTAGNHSTLTSIGAMGNYPLRSMSANLSRTAVAIAALAVSVSATAGVGIMIGSFRLSVENWLGNTLQADVYISVDSASSTNSLPRSLINKIESVPGVSGIRIARMIEAETSIAPARLMAVRAPVDKDSGYEFSEQINQPLQNSTTSAAGITKSTADKDRMRLLRTSNAIIISEPFARKSDLGVGSTVDITTDQGVLPFTVVGVFTNYTTGKGLMVMSLSVYQKYWNDRHINSVGVYFLDKAKSADITRQLRSMIAADSNQISLRSDTDIREQSLEIFDRTFAITHVLRLLTVAVAFVGILSALMALSLERRAEYAVLRALGITPAELRNLLFLQTGLMGLIAGVLALPLGIAMSQILVSVINVRSFGWSMEYQISPTVLVESLLLAIVAAVLAGLYPAFVLSRLSPAEALRHQ